MSFVLLANVILSVVTATQATGYLERVGIAGYVNAAQFGDINRLVTETRADQLVQQILDNTRRYCQAYEANDQSGMAFAFQALQESRGKYYKLLGREYPQLMCSTSAQPAKTTP